MYKAFQSFFMIAETPVHAGSGSELGIADLPIQRERYTNFPKIEGSGIKGCIREAFESLKVIDEAQKKSKLINSEKVNKLKQNFQNIEQEWKEKDKNGNEKIIKDTQGNTLIEFDRAIKLCFGPEESGDEHAGSIAFTDARILLFPIKSLKGVFAWITCPMVLNRFIEDMKIAGKGKEFSWNLTNVTDTVPQQTNLLVSGKVVLEEYTFEVKESEETKKIAEKLADVIFPDDDIYKFWKEKLKKDLVILSDDEFEAFVTTSTEVITRTKIQSTTGTVQPGALWTEEYLPQDSILYSIAMATPLRVDKDDKKGILKANSPEKEAQNVIEFFKQGIPEVIHIGGNQTIGKGIVRIKIFEGRKENERKRNNY